LMQELIGRYEKGTWFSVRHLQEGKKLKSPAEVREQLGLDASKKIAIIFPHVLWDATFIYGESLFKDYEEWLVETIKVACNNHSVNWVIKLHPDYLFRWKLKYRGLNPRELLALDSKIGRLPDHIKVVGPETEISTFSLFQVADYGLTVRGTIGVEMPCFGIPVFTAGSGRYSGFGFTIDSQRRNEYLEKIASIQNFPRLTESQTLLAKKHAYALFKLRPCVFRSFTLVQTPSSKYDHPLQENLRLCLESVEDFATATDLQAFADWAGDGTGADFLAATEWAAVSEHSVGSSHG